MLHLETCLEPLLRLELLCIAYYRLPRAPAVPEAPATPGDLPEAPAAPGDLPGAPTTSGTPLRRLLQVTGAPAAPEDPADQTTHT